MKIKTDFVTNSSSASFTIAKCNLTNIQISMIFEHINIGCIIAEKQGKEIYTDEWLINEDPTGEYIEGYTSMDNFDMLWFLSAIGIKDEYIDYDSDG